MNKPTQILELEKDLGDELELVENPISIFEDKTYDKFIVDEKGGIIGLNLSSCQLEDDFFFKHLKHFEDLEMLNLKENKIRDISFLSSLKKIKFLDLSNNLIHDVSILTELDKLVELNLSKNSTLSNIYAIKKLSRLEAIDLSFNRVPSIHPLHELTNLKTVNLKGNRIQSANFNNEQKYLEEINLSDNKITHIHLEGFQNLKKLNLSRNPLKTMSLKNNPQISSLDLKRLSLQVVYIEKLVGVKSIDLSFNEIKEISLKGLENLEELTLTDNSIEVFYCKNCPKIESLDLNDFALKDIFFKNTESLKKINLSNSDVLKLEFLNEVPTLIDLDLSNNQIFDISSISNLIFLEKLNLSWNQINDISAISSLPNIKYLNISFNKIDIGDYSSLKKLDKLTDLVLSSNEIENINFIEGIISLENLDLSSNQISDISALCNLINLKDINLSWNQISDISVLERLPRLEHLDLRINDIYQISLKNIDHLKSVNLSSNPIHTVQLDENKNIEVIHFSDEKDNNRGYDSIKEKRAFYLNFDQVQDISINNFNTLTEFSLFYQSVNSIHLSNCPKLKNVDVQGLQLKEFTLENVPNLKDLNLADNDIRNYSFVKDIPNIRTLILSGNGIQECSFLKGLRDLEVLNLSRNNIRKHTGLEELNQLKILDLSENKLTEVSMILIEKLSKLEQLYIDGNSIGNIPSEEYSGGGANYDFNSLANLRNHFKSIIEDEDIPNDQIKLLVLGNSKTGKSSLVHFLHNGSYIEDRISTHGIEHIIWNPYENDEAASEEKKNMKVAIWDFGGQEFYHSTHSLFFSENIVYLLVFEASTNEQVKKKTSIFLYKDGVKVKENVDIEFFDYNYWLDNIRHFSGKSSVLLVQNKSDIGPYIEITESCKEDYKLKSNENIFFISVKEAYSENEFFRDEFNLFRNKLLSHINENILKLKNSKKRQKIKNRMQSIRDEYNFLDYEEYVKQCKWVKESIDIKDQTSGKSELESFTEVMEKQGVLMYFKQIPELQHKVFINPNWLTDCIYRVLDYKVLENNGKFDLKHIEKKVAKIEGISSVELQKLLLHFKLIFEIEIKTNFIKKRFFIAPQYLPENFDKGTGAALTLLEKSIDLKISFVLSYPDFLPVSVFLKFLSAYGKYHYEYLYCKNKLVIRKDGKTVLAECIRTKEETDFVESIQTEKKRLIILKIQRQDKVLTKEFFDFLYDLDSSRGLEISVNGRDFEKIEEIKNPKYRKIYETDFWFVFNNTEHSNISNKEEMYLDFEKINKFIGQSKSENSTSGTALSKAIDELTRLARQTRNSEFNQTSENLSSKHSSNENKKAKQEVSDSEYLTEKTKILMRLEETLHRMQKNSLPKEEKNMLEIPTINSIEGELIKALQEALGSAYQDYDRLKMFLRLELNEKIENIVENNDMRTVTFKVIEFFESEGKLQLLIKKLYDDKRNNPDVITFIKLLREKNP